MTQYESKEKRMKKNQRAYDSLKIQLTDCPNFEFNHYVLSFVKTFMKRGRLKKHKSNNVFTLHIYNLDYNGYVMVKKENGEKEITISISPTLKNASQNMTKQITFDKGTITMLERAKYEDDNSNLLETTTLSIFENTCLINELGENNLVCRVTSERQLENGRNYNHKVDRFRIKKNGQALIEMWNSPKSENLYFKAKGAFLTFEESLEEELKDTSLPLKMEKTSFEEANNFVNEWLEENKKAREIENSERDYNTQSVNHLVLF